MKKIPYWYFLLLPTLLFVLGVLMNKLVIAANGGQMPVLWPGGCTEEGFDLLHTCMTKATRYRFLADWIVSHDDVSSPGDYLIDFYEFTFRPFFIIWAVLMIQKVRRADQF